MLDGIQILAVHHDSGLNGATLLFQSVLEGLARDYGASVSLRFPREGPIVSRARQLGPVEVGTISAGGRPRTSLRRLAAGLRRRLLEGRRARYDVLFANSAASLDTVERMQVPPRIPVVAYVHESPYMLRQVRDFGAVTRVLRRADLILAVSPAVRATLEEVIGPAARIVTVSGFVPRRPAPEGSGALPPVVRAAVSTGARIVGGVGTMSWYKGTDLFVAVARRIRQLLPQQRLVFIWMGEEWFPEVRRQLEHDIRLADLEGIVILPGGTVDPTPFFESLSLFLLPSREDSWPLVMLEAATAGVPIVCFQKSGGAEQFVASGGGAAVPYLDVEAMAQVAIQYLSDPELRARDSRAAQEAAQAVTAEEQIRKIACEIAGMLASRSAR